jgi:hypothetical protein
VVVLKSEMPMSGEQSMKLCPLSLNGGLMQDEKGLSMTLQPQYVCNLVVVARPAAALSGAPNHSAGGPQADSRHPGRK